MESDSVDEAWKEIPGLPPFMASDQGRIKRGDGSVIEPSVDGRGYYRIHLNGEYGGHRLHKLILLTFSGAPFEGAIGCHKNDIKSDNRADNLYWGTSSDNQKDAVRNGGREYSKFKIKRGEESNLSKYTAEQIIALRKEYTGEWGQIERLAKKYNMHATNVGLIVKGKRWKFLLDSEAA